MDDKYKDLIEFFDSRYDAKYVSKDSCLNRHEKLDEKLDDIKTEQTRIITRLEMSSKVEWAIAIAVAGSFITAVMNLILK